ncbi:unnamed protein product [Closterium sp. Yama58-4]|nr:unnamed protein product [Closterium sp. Yama58-4]
MGEHRAARTREQYPWARYRWLDSLLGLPSHRQRRFLAHRLATSPLCNALGGLVFLGTPFYVKTWHRHGVLLLLVTTSASVGVTFVVMWGYVLLWRVTVLAIAGELARVYLNGYPPSPSAPHSLFLPLSLLRSPLPSSLSRALHCSPHPHDQSHITLFLLPHSTFFLPSSPLSSPFLFLLLLLLSPPSTTLSELWRSTAFYSGNIYHSPGFDWSHAMSALVIHAGKLDEASLALSTEPIARAYIVPQLASMLKTPFWKPLPRRPTTNKCSDWTLYISNSARILLWNTIFILPATAVALLSRLLAPFVISVVRKAIVTVSFGLSPKELSFASVFVDECLHLDEWSPSHHVQHWNVQKLLALAKTRSLRGELMAGYENPTCDMGEAVFGEGLLEEGMPQEGVTGKGVAAEGLIGEGKAEERKEQEEVGEREVRVKRQGEGDERVGAEGAGGAGIDAIQTSVSRPQQGSCMHTIELCDSRMEPSGTHLGLGEAVESFGAAQQHMVAAAGEEGGQGRAPGSERRSLSRFRRRVTARRFTEQALRQEGERGEGGEEMGEGGGDSKEGRAGGGGSAAEGVGRAARRGGVGEASVEGAREEMKGKQQQHQQQWGTEKGVRPGHEGQLKMTKVQHGSSRQQRVSARGSREERVAYEFLWNDGALEAAASESATYKLLRPQLHAITHNPHLSDQECVRLVRQQLPCLLVFDLVYASPSSLVQVKQLCAMIEERFGELTGQFDLNHGAYFRDPRIIGAMVHFLGHRELPDWFREIDTDVLRAEERIRFGRLGHRGAGA